MAYILKDSYDDGSAVSVGYIELDYIHGGQTFTASSSYTLKRVSVSLARSFLADPVGIHVYIGSVEYDGIYRYTELAETTTSLYLDDLTTSPAWYDFDFDGVTITSGMYAIYIEVATSWPSQLILCGKVAGAYANGFGFFTDEVHGDWLDDKTWDVYFKTYATDVLPTVTIDKPISSITSVSGAITDTGGGSVTARGICYATGTTYTVPTTADHYVADTGGPYSVGAFYKSLTGVVSDYKYYARAFATSEIGTAYSSSSDLELGGFSLHSPSATVGITAAPFDKLLKAKRSLSYTFGIKVIGDVAKKLRAKRSFSFLSGLTEFPYTFPFIIGTEGSTLGMAASLLRKVSTTWLPSVSMGLTSVIKPFKIMTKIYATLGMSSSIIFKLSTALSTLFGLTSTLKPYKVGSKLTSTEGISVTLGTLKLAKKLTTTIGMHTDGLFSLYSYEKTVALSGSADGIKTNYPIKLFIHRASGTDSGQDVYVGTSCTAEYTDIYFTDDYGTPLWHWVEPNYTSTLATVWVNYSSIPIAGTYLHFFYGSTTVTIRNSGTNTFDFFDDFSSGLSKWTYGDGVSVIGEELVVTSTASVTNYAYSTTTYGVNYAMRARLKSLHSNSLSYIEYASITDNVYGRGPAASYCHIVPAINNNYQSTDIDGSSYSTISGWSADTYHLQDIIRNNDVSDIYKVDDSGQVAITTNIDSSARPIRFITNRNGAKVTVDWVFIRQYTTNEPSLGAWSSVSTYYRAPFISFRTIYNRLVTSSEGLVASYVRQRRMYRSLDSALGLTASSLALQGYFKRALSSSVGLTSTLSNYALRLKRSLQTSVGLSATLTSIAHLAQSLATDFGLVALDMSKRTGKIAPLLEASLGLVFKSMSQASHYRPSFSSSLGLSSTLSRLVLYRRALTSSVGLSIKSIMVFISKKFSVSVGLTADYIKASTARFSSSLGLTASIIANSKFYRSLQSSLGVTPSAPELARLFYETLSATLGLSASINWSRTYHRLLETSVGLSSSLNWVRAYIRSFITDFGIIASVSYTSIEHYYESLSASMGLVATQVAAMAYRFSTSMGLTATISKIKIGVKFIASVGIKALSVASRAFVRRKFKSLKFLDAHTSANKKLNIKK